MPGSPKAWSVYAPIMECFKDQHPSFLSVSREMKVPEALAVAEQRKEKSRRGAGRNRSPARWLYLEDLVLVVLDSAHQRGGESVLQKELNPSVVGLSSPYET